MTIKNLTGSYSRTLSQLPLTAWPKFLVNIGWLSNSSIWKEDGVHTGKYAFYLMTIRNRNASRDTTVTQNEPTEPCFRGRFIPSKAPVETGQWGGRERWGHESTALANGLLSPWRDWVSSHGEGLVLEKAGCYKPAGLLGLPRPFPEILLASLAQGPATEYDL